MFKWFWSIFSLGAPVATIRDKSSWHTCLIVMCVFSNNFLCIYPLILFKCCKSATPESMLFLVKKLTWPSLLFVFKEDLRKSYSDNASTVPQRSHFFSLVWCYEVSKSECVPCHMWLKFYYHLDQRQQQQQHWT